MSLLRKGLVNAQKVLYRSGLAWLYTKVRSRHGALILMYHSVSNESDRSWIDSANDCPDWIFDRQMAYLKKHCNVISMDALCEAISQGRELEPRTIVITFDDGYRNNLTVAATILAKYELPAIVYLATGYINRQEPQWIDELHWLFQQARHLKISLEKLDIENVDISDISTKLSVHRQIVRQFIAMPYEHRRNILNDLAQQLSPEREAPELTMSWDDVRYLREHHSNISLGVHTQDHVDLTSCKISDLQQQIHACSQDFKRELNADAKHFSYPYGRCNSDVESQVRAAGFTSAVVTEPASQIYAGQNPFLYSRIESPMDFSLFGFGVSGAYPDLSKQLFGRA